MTLVLKMLCTQWWEQSRKVSPGFKLSNTQALWRMPALQSHLQHCQLPGRSVPPSSLHSSFISPSSSSWIPWPWTHMAKDDFELLVPPLLALKYIDCSCASRCLIYLLLGIKPMSPCMVGNSVSSLILSLRCFLMAKTKMKKMRTESTVHSLGEQHPHGLYSKPQPLIRQPNPFG